MSSLFNRLPALHRYALAVVVLLVLLQSLLRVAFWVKFHVVDDPVSTHDLLWAFYLGMKFDLQVATGVVLPLLLLGWLPPLHPVYSAFGRRFWLLYVGLAILAGLSIAALDFGHYAYLQQRVNATALRFLENLSISATMVWETYPVIRGALLIVLATVAITWLFNRMTQRIPREPPPARKWYTRTAIVLLTLVAIVGGFMAKISWYPLRWSDAFFSPHEFSSQLASNPVIYFKNTLKNVAETYDLEAARQAYPLMADYLGVDQPDINTLNYNRRHTFDRAGKPRYNVIAVFLESFASYKSSLSGNPLHPTPHIEKLAHEGYYFKNYYTPTTGTARSVWALVTGIPDTELNRTSSRNPLIVDQNTIINAFEGYEKFYFLGGSASWANIRGMLSSNIAGLHIYEEGSYESPAIDVWGISDLDLFKEANLVLKEQKKPFFAIIQTSGNHRPYTIPDDNDNFRIWTEDDLKHDVTDYGFASLEELNSFRFMDHSIGRFMDIAAKESYFDNTLFVFYGDHGIHAPTGKHVPASEEQLHLQGLRVPLVLYGRNIIPEPKEFETVASEVDVLPTVAALTKTDYTNTTLGRDLLNHNYDAHRYAFTIEPAGLRTIGLVSDKYYFQRVEDGSNARLQLLGSNTARTDVSAQHPEIARTMADYLTAMWNTIRYMRENNHQREFIESGAVIQIRQEPADMDD
ncbi:MAG TPA: LTA synthase family protein [Thiotrichales bacterium]|nr:LTA synthase family protein [Thiotrichales bacterium]